MNDDLELKGHRFPWRAEYEVGFDENGKLNGIKIDLYVNANMSGNI